MTRATRLLAILAGLGLSASLAAQEKKKNGEASVPFPPALPGGKIVATDTSEAFLKPVATIKSDVAIARTAPTIDFSYVPGQNYPGGPWSCWGDGLAVNGKYYTSIGDHYALAKDKDPKRSGNAMVFEYDPAAKSYRLLVDTTQLVAVPEGTYRPGKIHSRLDQGDDGWVYFSTHRGSVSATRGNAFPFEGDYILRTHPGTGKSEVVARGPIPKHSIPNGILDPQRLIFYGGTIGPESYDGPVHFFAYDVKAGKVLYAGPDGPARCMILARSTGKLYYVPGGGAGPLMRYDPEKPSDPPVRLAPTLAIRATTLETPQGIVYAVSGKGETSTLYAFDVRTEKVEEIGEASVGTQKYIATLDADPTGRYLYYSAGAHGGSETDGTPVVQFDLKTRKRKVIAFLHPFYKETYGATLAGTFGMAVDPAGDKLYVTWNVNRAGGRSWDTVALSVIHIPASERAP
jgi:hypothetical protein